MGHPVEFVNFVYSSLFQWMDTGWERQCDKRKRLLGRKYSSHAPWKILYDLKSYWMFFSRRYIVLPKDFEKGYKNNIKKDETEHEFYK